MAYSPISAVPIQYSKTDGTPANGYYLKFYVANSSTAISMQTDSGGATSLAKCKLNESGYPISNPNDENTVFIPHLSTTYTAYRFVLYASAADADANNVTSGLPNIQSVEINAAITATEDLMAVLAASSGSSLVGFLQAGTGAVPRTLQSKMRDIYNAKDFGAVGDGIANDKAAIEYAAAAIPAVGGVLYIPAGTYYSPTGFLIQRSNITIIGDGMPRVSDDLSQLVGGTILQGTVLIDGNNVAVENLGADHGIAYSDARKAGAGGDGLVIHPVTPGQIKKNINVRNVVGLTRIGDYTDAQAAFHAVLIEGLRGGSADNVVGVGGWFGVVFKVADFNIGKVIGRENDAVSVQVKSNTYGPVDRVNIESVIVSNYIARGYVGFLILASDAELQAVTVGNVSVMEGINAVRVEGEVSQPCVSVAIGNITTRNGATGISVQGPVYGLTVGTASIWQPSGTGFYTGGNVGAAHPIDVTVNTLRVVPSGTSTKAVDIGSVTTKVVFGTVNAAGAGGGNLLTGSIIDVKPTTEIGQYFGTIKGNGSAPALVNGWASAYSQPTGLIVKCGLTCGYGRIDAAAATSDVFMTIPAGLHPDNLEFYTTMTGYDGGTTKNIPVTVFISATGNASIWPNRAAYTVSWYNLTDLSFPTRIPAEGGI